MADDEEITEGPSSSADERIQRVLAGFYALNATCRSAGEETYLIPPTLSLWAALDVIAQTLIDAGLITQEEYDLRTTNRFADKLEEALGEAAEQKRQTTGWAIPIDTMVNRPQG